MITINNRLHSHVNREPAEPEEAEVHKNNTYELIDTL